MYTELVPVWWNQIFGPSLKKRPAPTENWSHEPCVSRGRPNAVSSWVHILASWVHIQGVQDVPHLHQSPDSALALFTDRDGHHAALARFRRIPEGHLLPCRMRNQTVTPHPGQPDDDRIHMCDSWTGSKGQS